MWPHMVEDLSVFAVFLPDSTFPSDQVQQHMQQVTIDLKLEVEIQMNKVNMKHRILYGEIELME